MCLREDGQIGSQETKVIYQVNHDKSYISRVTWGWEKTVSCCDICYVGKVVTDKAPGIHTLESV
jgi:hypothetical protein